MNEVKKNGKQSRRKSCLCWAPDVIFNDKEDSDCLEVLPQDIQIRMDQYQSLIEPSVRRYTSSHSSLVNKYGIILENLHD